MRIELLHHAVETGHAKHGESGTMRDIRDTLTMLRFPSRLTSLFLFCFALPALTKATSVIVLWNHNQIIVAADSKATIARKDGTIGSKNICKIILIKGFIAAMSGMYFYPPTDFDASKDVIAALTETNNVKAAIDSANRKIIPAFRKAWHDHERRLSKFPEHQHEQGIRHLQYFIGEIVFPGQTTVAYTELIRDRPPIRHYDEILPNQFGRVAFGFNELSNAYFNNNPNWYQEPVTDLARRLIEQEAVANPGEVGGPVSVVLFDSRGPHWDPKGSCPGP